MEQGEKGRRNSRKEGGREGETAPNLTLEKSRMK